MSEKWSKADVELRGCPDTRTNDQSAHDHTGQSLLFLVIEFD